MTRVVSLRPEAQSEYDDGIDYAESWSPGRGADLVRAVDETLARLAANPALGTEVKPGVYKRYIPGTKYNIYYQFDDGVLDVVAVFHTSRDPADWQRRV